ncbi:MAG TPA: 30S ribosomal protein S3, partial [Spirochaetia bacterium]|nr:30S ribosomal protein S3 [Spirochaetia bacterium]
MGINKNWKSRWFSKSKYQEFLREDFIIREFLQNKLKKSGLGGIEIERSANSANVIVFSSRPGLIIGRGGSGIEDLRKELKSILIRKLKIDPKSEIKLSVEEIKSPESKASIVAQG